ncbi:MAG TPA: transposase, partial [Verrucomicrobiae bacterium]|nr:transposase [Verrucomicrobiae bacterium]
MDVHKRSVSACVWVTSSGGKAEKYLRQFGTTTPELQELAKWLQEFGVTHVAMESTGVYWRPIYEILEESVTILVVNAQHVHGLPG